MGTMGADCRGAPGGRKVRSNTRAVELPNALWLTIVVFWAMVSPGASWAASTLQQPSLQELRSPLGQAQRAFQLQGAHYGTLPDDHPAVLRSRGIFRKLVRVAGVATTTTLSLFVLDTPKIIAQSFDQGIIVISLGLFDRIGSSDDDALAFILGHEIAHQTRGHHSLLRGLGVQLSPSAPAPGPLRPDQIKTFHALEIDADRFGVLYSSLAGYQARAAIPTIGAIAEVLGPDPLHPEPGQRAGEIRRQVAEVLDHHEVYLLGLAYLAIGRLEEAARIFKEFQHLYPSREVFLNLGVAYHKRAMLYAVEDGFHRSIVIDPRPRIGMTLRGITPTMQSFSTPHHLQFSQYLEQATEAYQRASAMDPEDPVAHNNLGLAHLDGGRFEYALGELRSALQADVDFAAAYNNRGITYAKSGDLKRAEVDLRDAARKDPQYWQALENLIVVYQQLGNVAAAGRARQALDRLAQGRTPSAVPAGPLTVEGIQLGMAWVEADRILATPFSRQIAVPLSVTPGHELVLRVHGPRGLAVAVEKGIVTAVGILERGVARLPYGVDIGTSADRLRQTFGSPTRIEGVREVSLWVYPEHGLVTLIARGRVSGIWAVSP